MAQCAPTTVDELREKPGVSGTFEVPLPLEAVFANEQRGSLACMTGSYERFTFAIRPRIDPASRTASISLVHDAGPLALFAPVDYWALIDMQATEKGTMVHAYSYGHALMEDFAVVAHKWALGQRVCQTYAITTRQYPLTE